MTSIDEYVEVVIDDVPQMKRLRIVRNKRGAAPYPGALGWDELERMSSLRMWSAVLAVPLWAVKDAGPSWDDMRYLQPPLIEPELDRFAG